MAWTLEYSRTAVRALSRLDQSQARRITRYMKEVAGLDDPRARGKALTGNLAGLWRYRVGDFRVITEHQGERLVVLILEVGHRSTVYTD